MKKIFFVVTFLITFKVFGVDICVMTTKVGDPFTTAQQDCTQIAGGAGSISIKQTSDHLLFLYNNGFSIVSVTSVAATSSGTSLVYTLKRD